MIDMFLLLKAELVVADSLMPEAGLVFAADASGGIGEFAGGCDFTVSVSLVMGAVEARNRLPQLRQNFASSPFLAPHFLQNMLKTLLFFLHLTFN